MMLQKCENGYFTSFKSCKRCLITTIATLMQAYAGILMGTSCAPLVADLFLFCYERDFMLSLSDNNQTGVIEAFNSTSRYLDD